MERNPSGLNDITKVAELTDFLLAFGISRVKGDCNDKD